MITKADTANVTIDWDKVERETEVPRTYFVHDGYGHRFFKMYKPSEAEKIFEANGWTGNIASILRRKQ